jgi:prepilin-type processing-associated H-X9-DG protein
LHTIHPGRGFTLVETLVVVTLLVALVGVSVPAWHAIQARSHQTNCAANLRQIGVATMLYASDNHMTLPVTSHQRRQGGKSWTLTLQPYASGTIAFKCPKDPVKNRSYTYVLNDYLTPNPAGAPGLNYSILANLTRPEATMMFGEASPSYQNSDHFHFSAFHGGSVPASVFEAQVNTRAHGDRTNYLFADGHVESFTRSEALARINSANTVFINPSNTP